MHHLVAQDLVGCKTAQRLEPRYEGEVARADYVVGHNLADFDLPILRRAMPEAFSEQLGIDAKVIDTLHLARRAWPDIASRSLQALRYRFALPASRGSAHHALFDAKLCGRLLELLLTGRKLGPDVATFAAAAKLWRQPLQLKVMPFGKHKGKALAQVPASYWQWLKRQDDWPAKHRDLAYSLEQLGQ